MTKSAGRPFPLPGDRPHYAPDRPFEFVHLCIEVKVDLDARRIEGTTTHRIRPIAPETLLHLNAVALEIGRVRANGRDVRFTYDGAHLYVDLGGIAREGEEIAVAVEYAARPRRGLYFFAPDAAYPDQPKQAWSQGEDEDNRHWFPCHDYPNVRMTSEVIATVPRGYFALSNGTLTPDGQKDDPASGTTRFHWRHDIPHVSYLVTLAVGEFAEHKEKVGEVELAYYFPKGREEDARRAFEHTARMLEVFSERTGQPYPYPKYAQIVVANFIWAGMENTTATTLHEWVLHDERAALDYSPDPLVAHELAHQWFGDLLTCRDWSHAWLNEGFATFFELVFREKNLGRDEYLYAVREEAGRYMDEDRARYRRPIVERVYNQPTDLFDRHIYEKGAIVLHMLREWLGEGLFWRGIREYVRRHKGKSVETNDLVRAFEDVTGRSLGRFFDQWVFRHGYPALEVELRWEESQKLARLMVRQTQTKEADTPVFRAEVPVRFRVAGQDQEVRVHLGEDVDAFTFRFDERPSWMAFDPHYALLKRVEWKMPADNWIRALSGDAEAAVRWQAAEALAREGSHAAVEALGRQLLEDPFWGVQAECASALGTIRTERAFDALVKGLAVPHPKARRAVVVALGSFRTAEAAEVLGRILSAKDASYFVEAEAARSLGRTRAAKAFDVLKPLFDRPSYRDVIRAAAIDGLGELYDERVLPVVLGETKYGLPVTSRRAAIAALGRMGDAKREVVERLCDLLDDPDLYCRSNAVDALAKLGDLRAVAPLERRLRLELDGRVIRGLREALRDIRTGKSKSDEIKNLRDEVDRMNRDQAQLRDRLERAESLAGKPLNGGAKGGAQMTPNAQAKRKTSRTAATKRSRARS